MPKHYNSCFPHVTSAELCERERQRIEQTDAHFAVFAPEKVGTTLEQKQQTLCGEWGALDELTDEGSDCPPCSQRLKSEIADEAQDSLRDEELNSEWKYFEDRAAQWSDYPRRTEDLD